MHFYAEKFLICITNLGSFGLIVAPENKDIITGETHYLPCVAFSSKGRHITITWRRGGREITNHPSNWAIFERNATENGISVLISVLELNCVSAADAMDYTCSATDGRVSQQESFSLNFLCELVLHYAFWYALCSLHMQMGQSLSGNLKRWGLILWHMAPPPPSRVR